MILLGSIDRLELLALCDWWLSPERRLLMQVRAVRARGQSLTQGLYDVEEVPPHCLPTDSDSVISGSLYCGGFLLLILKYYKNFTCTSG